ncbi:MAG: DMT family transporter [Gammaproteobacteria bacterium]|nr:DMT family transporter [Gammaproteobacteria bacterium]
MALFFIVLAVLAGGMLPVQGVVNSQLGRVLDNVVLATLISFVVGSLTLLLVFFVRNNWADDSGLQQLPEVPPVLYVGGVLGAFYVTLVAILIPKIGVANTMIAIILGQVLLSLLLDHFGFLSIEVRQINWQRILGASLVLSGLVLVVKN